VSSAAGAEARSILKTFCGTTESRALLQSRLFSGFLRKLFGRAEEVNKICLGFSPY
jgi:hypothetical protein